MLARSSYTKEQQFLVTEMDIIKFICKEFWGHVFKRQVDKLQTNYKVLRRLEASVICARDTDELGMCRRASMCCTTSSSGGSCGFRIWAARSTRLDHTLRLHAVRMFDQHNSAHESAFPGILRGALSNLGVNATVKAELVKVPSCESHVLEVSR